MKNVLVLGATGRTGNFIIKELDSLHSIQITVGIRTLEDFTRIPKTSKSLAVSVLDINDEGSLMQALINVDIVVNALRMRNDASSVIESTALVELDKRLREATKKTETPHIISVGGAGALNYPDKTKFWQDPLFPKKTFPRGKAQAQLREYLEALPDTSAWSYLIPPPIYDFDGLRTGDYRRVAPSADERFFLNKSISYQDFAIAIRDSVSEEWIGTHLVGNV